VSRIGKAPIPIPKGVEVKADREVVRVKGPKGELVSRIPAGISVSVSDGQVRFTRDNEEPQQRAFHGLLRSLVANSVEGVTKGFTKELEIVGVGYKAEVKGKSVVFALGYSHPINFAIPDGISVALDAKAGKLTISGADRQKVGQTAAEIRSLRVPDPYKAKGIKYANEIIRRKVGKAGGK
jgi:large subunit ribosomal protein L6